MSLWASGIFSISSCSFLLRSCFYSILLIWGFAVSNKHHFALKSSPSNLASMNSFSIPFSSRKIMCCLGTCSFIDNSLMVLVCFSSPSIYFYSSSSLTVNSLENKSCSSYDSFFNWWTCFSNSFVTFIRFFLAFFISSFHFPLMSSMFASNAYTFT